MEFELNKPIAGSPLSKVAAAWEEKTGKKLSEEKEIEFLFCFIETVDQQTVNTFVNAERLSLSSNLIKSQLPDFHLDKLVTLSLGRNRITFSFN